MTVGGEVHLLLCNFSSTLLLGRLTGLSLADRRAERLMGEGVGIMLLACVAHERGVGVAHDQRL
jgi:hypothetical protein